MTEGIDGDNRAEDAKEVGEPLTGDALAAAYAQQTQDLLEMGQANGASASKLADLHLYRSSVLDGNPQGAAKVAKLLGWGD